MSQATREAATSALPAGWQRVRLGDILKLRKDVLHPSEQPTGQATFVGLEHVESHAGRRIGAVDLDLSRLSGRKPRFYKGDIVYGYLRPYLNKVWVAEFDGLCSVDQYVYSPLSDVADPNYVGWFMRSPTFLRRAPIHQTPGQLPRIRTEEVASVRIELPPLTQQRRIAAVLCEQIAAVERARAAAESQREAAESLPTAYMRAVFENPEASAWPRKPLGEALRGIQAGKSMTCEERPAKPDEWGVLKVSAVSWGAFRPDENKALPPTHEPILEHEVRAGDLLISRCNTTELVGAVTRVRKARRRLLLCDKTLRLLPDEALAVKPYLEAALREKQARAFIEAHATGASGSMKNISQDVIRSIPVLLPPVGRQRLIAERLHAEFAGAAILKQKLQEQRDAIGALPAALLRQTFTGEL